MKFKKTFLVLTTLFILLGSNLALAVSSGESGDVGPSSSGEVVPPISSGEIVPPVSSGETSNVLLSTANDSRFVIKKGEVLKS